MISLDRVDRYRGHDRRQALVFGQAHTVDQHHHVLAAGNPKTAQVKVKILGPETALAAVYPTDFSKGLIDVIDAGVSDFLRCNYGRADRRQGRIAGKTR